MTPLTPSTSFRMRHSESANQLAQACDAKWLRDGLDYSLAQLAFEGVTDAELRGANRLITTLLTMHTESVEPARLPDKSRLPSYEAPSIAEYEQTRAER